MSKTYRIAPSILSANFAKLGQEIDDVIASGTDFVHFDVMDNHFVPNLTIGPLVCESIREIAGKVGGIIDVHLMVEPVDRIIPDFAKAGANIITFHPEASKHIDRSLSLHYLDYVMDKVDMILLMSVNPGFGGQKFIPSTLQKLREARARIDAYTKATGREIYLEVDGGVNAQNIAEIAKAGADTFVAGNAIFTQGKESDKNRYNTIVSELRASLAAA
jgi:ribulose-phosphate 3-epimerase